MFGISSEGGSYVVEYVFFILFSVPSSSSSDTATANIFRFHSLLVRLY